MLTAVVSGALLGLVNLAHCASMCGPLSSAACGTTRRAGLLRYQGGRMLGYAFLGALSGHVGEAIGLLRPSMLGVWLVTGLTVGACVLTMRAVLRTSASPQLVQLRLGKGRYASGLQTLLRLLPKEPLVLGLLSAALPCGVLASAVLAAVATGSGARGALLMLGFAASSGAAVLGAGAITRWVPRRFGRVYRWAVAGVLVATALITLARPIRALASSAPGAATGSVHCH